MRTGQRPRQAYRITSVGARPVAAVRRRRRRWPWALGAIAVLVAAALVFAWLAWPKAGLAASPIGLARLSQPSFGGTTRQITAQTEDGRSIPVTLRNGVLWPKQKVEAGTRLRIDVLVKRPSWVGWIAGGTERMRVWITTPTAKLQQHWLQVRPGGPVRVQFSRPVREVKITSAHDPKVVTLRRPSRTVTLDHVPAAGSVAVSAAVWRWETLSAAEVVTWFPESKSAQVIASPTPGATLKLGTPIVLRFSKPVSDVFHGKQPWLGRADGSWRVTEQHTLVFTPRSLGYGFDAPVKLHLPAWVKSVDTHTSTRLLTWTTPTGSALRLQQLLAELGYMPLTWQPKVGEDKPTLTSEYAAAVSAPDGAFTWKYGNVPDQLRKLWHPGRTDAIERGAIMAFESDHDLLTDGYIGPAVWNALITAAVAHDRTTAGYSYVVVHRQSSPQTLTLWHDGQTILTTPANTGIPQAPTALGTFPVYARFKTTTMTGTAPDGSHYSDPGIPWVSYFNGGDAIHGFTRASYGSPQSLGCVELPASEAARVYPYTPIGTLVTVEN